MPDPGPHTHVKPPSIEKLASTMPAFPPATGDRTALLAELRARIRGLEGLGGEGGRTLPFGVEAVDSALPGGGLPLGCLHEVTAEDPGVGTAFAAGLLARLAAARPVVWPVMWPVMWIVRGRDLHAAGLAAYGLTPDRLIVVRARRDADALWAMEEALRCPHLSAVLGEAGRLDLTASRRLQLAAESSGVTGVLLRLGADRSVAAATAAVTRWRIAPAPAGEEADHGVGEPRWRVTLERCRGGRPGAWLLDWRDGGLAEAIPHTVPAHTTPAHTTPARRLVPSTVLPGPATSVPAHQATAWTAVA